jgi:hypothetical protein
MPVMSMSRRGNTPKLALTCVIALLWTVGCANTPIPGGPLSEVDFERWSVHVLTWDADGDRRKTRVWIATVEGLPYIRTGQTRWWQNIERGSQTQILVDGYAYPVSTEEVEAPSLRAQIDEAFTAKYGWLGRLVIDDERARSDDPYLRLTQAAQDEGARR